MVALTVPGAHGALRRRLAATRALFARTATAAGERGKATAATVAAALLAVQGLAGLALISFGAWLAWEPAGFIVAGVGLLADRLLDERSPS